MSVLNGEDGTFGNWSSKGIGILKLDDGRKVFSPMFDKEYPMKNYTIEKNITVQVG